MNKLRNYIRIALLKIWFNQNQIENFYIKMYRYLKIIKNPFYRLLNYLLYKFWIRKEIEYILKLKLLWNKEIFWDNEFYQSYPPLDFKWERDTLLRFKNYNIEKYINKDTIILDIWWNVGFFSLYISKYVKYIDVIEYNKNLVDIGNILKNYEKIDNISIIQKDFNEYTPTKKYDIIFSFAVHKWIWIPFKEYIKKLISFLNKNWYIFLESQNLDIDSDFEKNIKQIEDMFQIISLTSTNENTWYIRKIAILWQLKISDTTESLKITEMNYKNH